jgi:hypothetical protein
VTPAQCWVKAQDKLFRLRQGLYVETPLSSEGLAHHIRRSMIDEVMKLLDEGLEAFEQAALYDIQKNGT